MNINVTIIDNQLICSFRRKLNTGDLFDVTLHKNHVLKVCSQDSPTTSLVKHKTLKDVFCFNWPLK